MKTEHEIAKGNVKELRKLGISLKSKVVKNYCILHIASLKRECEFLGVLILYKYKCGFMEGELCEVFSYSEIINERIQDIKNALAEYSEKDLK